MTINRIPYSIANHEQLIRDDYLFVDKTRYIRDLEVYTVPVFLRPRRFGKSLFCSTLECYYDVNRRDRFDELFGSLDIGKNPTPNRNSCMVMRFDFSVIEVKNDIDFVDECFRSHCRDVVSVFLARYREYFPNDIDRDGAAGSLLGRVLSECDQRGLPPVYIIIDEYDNFTNQMILAQWEDLYNQVTTSDSFLRTFFKTIKSGIQNGTVGRFFATGVLPITIDDLTSGFNVAEIITLEPTFHSMLGFTESEVDTYLTLALEAYDIPLTRLPEIRDMLRQFYNGYRFDFDSEESLYNSTILNFFLKRFCVNGGKIPREFIDDNLRPDVSWLRRLTRHEETTRELLETLMYDRSLPFDYQMLRSKFNMRQFFDRDFYPLSLFYLGMLTFEDEFALTFPNQSVHTIITDYYNEVMHLEVSKGYTDYMRQFLKDLDLEALFAGYWETYVGQIPAQAFDQLNEGFFRTTFYELCTRYLSGHFVFAIEANHPSGRSDWELLGKHHSAYRNVKFIAEFKHFSKPDAKHQEVLTRSTPFDDDVAQVTAYANDVQTKFPEYQIRTFVIYTASNQGFRCFEVTDNPSPPPPGLNIDPDGPHSN